MLLPDRKNAVVYQLADDEGNVIIQMQGRKMMVRHNRLKLLVPASELYPPDYDFSIVFDTVANRKAAHTMERKFDPDSVIVVKEGKKEDWFDAIVSVDSYHYFGCKKGVFAEKILPFVRRGGNVMIAVPGLGKEPQGEMRKLFETWAEGDDTLCFHTVRWWEKLLKEDCGDRCDITVTEGECFDEAWQDWYQTCHEFAIRDREFLPRGLDRILNFVLIYARKK